MAVILTLPPAPASAERDATPVEKGLKYRTRAQKRNPLIIQQTVVEQPITIIQNQNLGLISQLAAVAEQQFAALVQSQVALVTQLEEIKNNIRVNHFRASFNTVVSPPPLPDNPPDPNISQNTVIVTVTNVIDARDPANVNKRYLLNQLLADNGVPDKQLLVMVTQAQAMTIGASPTIDLSGILGTAASASAVSTPTAGAVVAGFDPNAPFASSNGSLILPYNTSAPSNALVFEDPANIIFLDNSNSNNQLFVQSAVGFQNDCAAFTAQQNSFVNLAALQLFGSVQAALAAQLATINLGTALPLIPPSVLAGNAALASALASLSASASATAARSSSSTTETATAIASAAVESSKANEG
jgi:hypothetical protein